MSSRRVDKKAIRRVELDARRYIDAGAEVYTAWQKAMDDLKGTVIDVEAYVHDIENEAPRYVKAEKTGNTKELVIAAGVIIAALVGIKKLIWNRLKRYGLSPTQLQSAIDRTESKLRNQEYADIPSLLGKLSKFKVSLKDKVRSIANSIKTGVLNIGNSIGKKLNSMFSSVGFNDRIVHDAMYRRKKMCHYALQGVTRRDSIGSTRFIIDSYARHNLNQLLKPIRGLSTQQTNVLNRRIDAAILRRLDRVIYSRGMRKDFLAAAATFAISNLLVPLLVRIISAPIVKVLEAPGAALQESVKKNLTDPITSKIKGQAESVIGKLKQIISAKGKDQSVISALWNGVKPDLLKLIDSLKREGGNFGRSILGALKSGVDKISQIFSRKDSRYALYY